MYKKMYVFFGDKTQRHTLTEVLILGHFLLVAKLAQHVLYIKHHIKIIDHFDKSLDVNFWILVVQQYLYWVITILFFVTNGIMCYSILGW